MSQTEIDWGLDNESASPARFPVDDTVLGPKPFHEGIFEEIDRLLTAGNCVHGRFEVETAETRLTCLIHQSSPFLAGLLERDLYSQVPLANFAVRARQLEDATCSLVTTDNSCVLMAGVHFCKRPHLHGSTRLVNPAHVLRVLARQKQDAALAFERQGHRTLLFLSQGQPARLFFGDPRDDPRQGDLSDRILLYAFADEAPPSKVEVYTSLKLPPDPDRGTPLLQLAEETKPCPPAMVGITMADGREVRRRPFVPPAMVIGHDPSCNLFIDNLAVSRRHARLAWERGHFVIEDLGSANGTVLDGEPVGRATVTPDQQIELGKFRVTLAELASTPSAPETLFLGAKQVASLAGAEAAPGYLIGEGRCVKLTGDVLIGRGEGLDVPAEGFFVGPVHARVTRDRGHYRVTCFGNRKVRVNGRKVGSSQLEFGDRIIIGRSQYELLSEADVPSVKSAVQQ